ncbi:MAG: dienelactone hydrolase-like enzyme [Actinomycetia bacterium]|nr:dienelactone hydrolase-like enzyme [Actinomycetes bacterium]
MQELTAETTVLRVDGDEVPAYHVRPDGMPIAGVVLHPDIMGLRPLFEDMARRLATHGFAVAAIDPFSRYGDDQRASAEARMAAVAQLDDATQLADLEAAANLLVVEDDVFTISVMGFCIGGYYTFKAAASDRFDRAVAFYGMLRTPEPWRGPGHRDPLDVLANACPTLAVFGGADPYTPPEDIEALRKIWADRKDCEIIVIEGAEHGFVHDPDRPAHLPEAAAMVWEKALAWIKP